MGNIDFQIVGGLGKDLCIVVTKICRISLDRCEVPWDKKVGARVI
jgi:hypothetical protein